MKDDFEPGEQAGKSILLHKPILAIQKLKSIGAIHRVQCPGPQQRAYEIRDGRC